VKQQLVHRAAWLAATAGLVLALLWLDQHRGGPATMLSRCNLLLSRSGSPAADVLIVGSSRTGTALDPIEMRDMLARASGGMAPSVERLALGQSPLRATLALLKNYLESRGAPRVIALELMFDTQRTIDRLAERGFELPPERYIFRRDLNLMTFEQIAALPSVAMPFSEREGFLTRWQFRLRGIVLRAGALVYEFLRHPADRWDLTSCDHDSWTREPEWPADFSFSFGSYETDAAPSEVIESMRVLMSEQASIRALKPWQKGVPLGQRYPYDFEADYREGEVALLRSILDLVSRYDVAVVLLPMTLYGYEPSPADLEVLADSLPAKASVFDVYANVQSDLGKFWYDDAHIEPYPAGVLATAVLAQHLLDAGLLDREETTRR